MMNEVNKISRVKIKRSAETVCTAGQTLQAQVYSDMFPFAYDVPQFNACLSVQTLKDNLEAVTDRVYDRSYQRIILDKLNQAYPGGLSDQVLQVLGSASHVATPDDVRKWNVTKIDTLSSLMNQRKGDWDPEMVQLLVSKYLSVNGNTLGSNELNALGGTNLCALNTSVLNSITAASVE
ncbi:mesothelin-like protein [Sinocyclocheilus rhinocerous]|uniref:mesothelin-like protein n=1 Tax=Sinocyclocheilus rhinocerous TaxID=307959 RepID=UPI0007B9C66D|nr:PREDICTED: mesothelin-like protein [Sinocyclocheilus rhinocerous]